MVTRDASVIRARFGRNSRLALLFGLAYFCVNILASSVGFDNGWTIVWPINGVTVALLLMYARADWPAMLFGIAVGTAIGEGPGAGLYLHPATATFLILERLISLAEVLLSAWLLPRFSGLDPWLREPGLVGRFCLAILVGPGASGILAALLFHSFRGATYTTGFLNWAPADALGIALAMPISLAFRSPEMRALFRRNALPRVLLVLGLFLLVATLSLTVTNYPILFFIYPTLLLVESRLGFAGSSIAVGGLSIIAVYLTCMVHIGRFGVWDPTLFISRNAALQLFLGFHVVAFIPISIFFLERKRISDELRDSNRQLLLLASIDGLTALSNRRALDERFAQEWSRALRLQSPLSLVMIDIDHFKQFNDVYGHHGGDECLRRVADTLRLQPHRSHDLLARFGGEEFALLLPHTELAGAIQNAEQLRAAVFALDCPHEKSSWGRVTISIGCAVCVPRPEQDPTDLLLAADAALYESKRLGRNQVQPKLDISWTPHPIPTTFRMADQELNPSRNPFDDSMLLAAEPT